MSTKLYVGTVGWKYSWNHYRTLEWYAKYSKLNAIELDFSYRKTPNRENMIKYRMIGGNLKWIVSVSRKICNKNRITHWALTLLDKLMKNYEVLDDIIRFYLFIMPEKFRLSKNSVRGLEWFLRNIDRIGLKTNRLAFQFNNPEWYSRTKLLFDLVNSYEIVVVNPLFYDFSSKILIDTKGTFYIKFLGSNEIYSDKDLESIAIRLYYMEPKEIYALFDNNETSLENALRFKQIYSTL